MIRPATVEDQYRAFQAIRRRSQRLAEGDRSPFGTYPECPLCGGTMIPEHAHFKCSECGWRDSCCD